MAQFSWSVVISGIFIAWLRSELGVGFEGLTMWILRRPSMQPWRAWIESLRSPTARFLCVIAVPMLRLPGAYIFVVVSMAKSMGITKALIFVGSSIGFIVGMLTFGIQIIDHFVPSSLGQACLKWSDTFMIVLYFVIGPPTMYFMFKEEKSLSM